MVYLQMSDGNREVSHTQSSQSAGSSTGPVGEIGGKGMRMQSLDGFHFMYDVPMRRARGQEDAMTHLCTLQTPGMETQHTDQDRLCRLEPNKLDLNF